MANVVFVNVEFVLWAEDHLNYGSTLETINVLQKANKVDLGKLYVAFRDNKECPMDLAYKIEPIETFDMFVERKKLSSHAPTNIQKRPYSAELEARMRCAKCGSLNITPIYDIPWVPSSELPFSDSTRGSYACGPCYNILYKTMPYVKPNVKFMTDDI